jgi:hypothetical protein
MLLPKARLAAADAGISVSCLGDSFWEIKDMKPVCHLQGDM